MAKFLRLIQNEMRKLLLKKATVVLLILLAVIAVGAVVLQALDASSSSYYGDVDAAPDAQWFCDSQIQYYQDILNNADQYEDPEAARAEAEREIEAYTIMKNNNIAWGDWRYAQELPWEAANAKLSGNTALYNELLFMIEQNDADRFFEKQKQNYQSIYADDTKRLNAYVDMADYCMEKDVKPIVSDWRYDLIQTYLTNLETVLTQEELIENGFAHNPTTLETAKNEAAIAKYQLDHDLPFNPADSFKQGDLDLLFGGHSGSASIFWNVLAGSVSLISLVGMLLIIFAGGIVANEFSAGTVKFLLIAPVKRWKILMSKYATCCLMSLLMTAILFVFTILPALFVGASDMIVPALEAKGGEVATYSAFLLLLRDYAGQLLSLLVIMTMSFALSALFRNAALAVGVGIFTYLSGSLASMLLFSSDMDWGRYLLFSNLDLVSIAQGEGIFPHQSVATAVIIIVLHMTVFLLTAWDAFVKREV